jgi:hypothetical protein
VPLFPADPYSDRLGEIEEDGAISRQDILSKFDTPWAEIGQNGFVYISDKPSSALLWGVVGGYVTEGGALPMSRRDFIATFDFDSQGMLTGFETYQDSGNHDHCFSNGICFKREQMNVPLAPKWMDAVAKRFEPKTGYCAIYIYRDDYTGGKSYAGYVDIQIAEKKKSIGMARYPRTISRSIGSSVPGGFFKLYFDPQFDHRLTATFAPVKSYPFKTNNIQDKRKRVVVHSTCTENQVSYYRLAVPKDKKLDTVFQQQEKQQAQLKIGKLQLLAHRYSDVFEQPFETAITQE